MKKCDLCEKQFKGHGHNTNPFKGKVCYDACHQKLVVPIRMVMAESNRKPTKKERELADKLWELLKTAFNEEAEHYVQAEFHPFTWQSKLGSIGPIESREVMRSAWWDYLEAGKLFGEENYDRLTRIIEREHCGEQLETGKISFGS